MSPSASRPSSPGRTLVYRECPPGAALAPWVTRFYQLCASAHGPAAGEGEIDAADPMLRRLLPNGDANLVFDLGDRQGFFSPACARARGRNGLVLGAFPEPVDVRFGRGLDLFGLAFAVGRARPFVGVAAPNLTGRMVRLEDLWDDSGALERGLRRASTFEARVALARRVLERRIPGRLPTDEDLLAVIEEARSGDPAVRVAALASGCGLSRQRFTRWFGYAVGMGPKRFARVSRLQRLLARVTRGPVDDWSGLALRFGYYDQAHMIADFRWMTGMSPARFVEARERGQRE